MRFDILTIFPDFFCGPLDFGIVRRTRETGLIEVKVHDLRAFTRDRHHTVDDRPFGGGEGMVLKPAPIFECVADLNVLERKQRISGIAKEAVILLSPQGQLFRQDVACALAQLERVVLICGRYEGVDERVNDYLADREVSVGDFVLSGGEIAATIVVDAVTRLIPGALGNEASAQQESFTCASKEKEGVISMARSPRRPAGKDSSPVTTCSSGGLLDYPHYTRPADYSGMAVPEVLISGNHDEIRRWRRRKALEKTLRNRPDLLDQVALSVEERAWIAELRAEAELRR